MKQQVLMIKTIVIDLAYGHISKKPVITSYHLKVNVVALNDRKIACSAAAERSLRNVVLSGIA